ncbi:MAG TPA: CbtA family protein [Dongiaceae bacterium]|jgi:cobalt transporter subunit CbtA
MSVFRQILFTAAIAGLIGGLLLTLLQNVGGIGVVPIILEAETYENAAPDAAATGDATAVASADGHDHEHGAEAWAPEDGAERLIYTLLTNTLMAVGFALMLGAGFALAGGANAKRGLLWGLAGFATFMLAPSLGLPPEVPGTEAAALADRQLWWWATVLATGSGIALLVYGRRIPLYILAAALILAPHVIGAPQPAAHGGLAPESLAREFIIVVMVTMLLFWLALGAVSGFFYKRFSAA